MYSNACELLTYLAHCRLPNQAENHTALNAFDIYNNVYRAIIATARQKHSALGYWCFIFLSHHFAKQQGEETKGGVEPEQTDTIGLQLVLDFESIMPFFNTVLNYFYEATGALSKHGSIELKLASLRCMRHVVMPSNFTS